MPQQELREQLATARKALTTKHDQLLQLAQEKRKAEEQVKNALERARRAENHLSGAENGRRREFSGLMEKLQSEQKRAGEAVMSERDAKIKIAALEKHVRTTETHIRKQDSHIVAITGELREMDNQRRISDDAAEAAATKLATETRRREIAEQRLSIFKDKSKDATLCLEQKLNEATQKSGKFSRLQDQLHQKSKKIKL